MGKRAGWVGVLGFAAQLVVVGGCVQEGAVPPPAGVALRETFLPSLGLTIDLPPTASVHAVGRELVLYLDGGRAPLTIYLAELAQPAKSAPAQTTRTLANGATVRYAVRDLGGAGSGGDEAELAGQLFVRNAQYSVRCHHQAEAPAAPAPELCLPYLATVRRPPTH